MGKERRERFRKVSAARHLSGPYQNFGNSDSEEEIFEKESDSSLVSDVFEMAEGGANNIPPPTSNQPLKGPDGQPLNDFGVFRNLNRVSHFEAQSENTSPSAGNGVINPQASVSKNPNHPEDQFHKTELEIFREEMDKRFSDIFSKLSRREEQNDVLLRERNSNQKIIDKLREQLFLQQNAQRGNTDRDSWPPRRFDPNTCSTPYTPNHPPRNIDFGQEKQLGFEFPPKFHPHIPPPQVPPEFRNLGQPNGANMAPTVQHKGILKNNRNQNQSAQSNANFRKQSDYNTIPNPNFDLPPTESVSNPPPGNQTQANHSLHTSQNLPSDPYHFYYMFWENNLRKLGYAPPDLLNSSGNRTPFRNPEQNTRNNSSFQPTTPNPYLWQNPIVPDNSYDSNFEATARNTFMNSRTHQQNYANGQNQDFSNQMPQTDNSYNAGMFRNPSQQYPTHFPNMGQQYGNSNSFSQSQGYQNSGTQFRNIPPNLSAPPCTGNFRSFIDPNAQNWQSGGNINFSNQNNLPSYSGSYGNSQMPFNSQLGQDEGLQILRDPPLNPNGLIRAFDIKQIKKFKGHSDHRSPWGFIKEFETLTDSFSEYEVHRARCLIQSFDHEKFQAAKSFVANIGYTRLRNYFLSIYWNDASREQMVRSVEDSVYDPKEFENEAEFVLSLYSKLYDCRVPIRAIWTKIYRKLPSAYQNQLRMEDCASYTGFIEAVENVYSLTTGGTKKTYLVSKKNQIQSSAHVMSIEGTNFPQITYAEENDSDDQDVMSGNE